MNKELISKPVIENIYENIKNKIKIIINLLNYL